MYIKYYFLIIKYKNIFTLDYVINSDCFLNTIEAFLYKKTNLILLTFILSIKLNNSKKKAKKKKKNKNQIQKNKNSSKIQKT